MRSFNKLLVAAATCAAMASSALAATVYDLSNASCSLSVSECTTASGVFLESPGNTMGDFPNFHVGLRTGSHLYFTLPETFDTIVDLSLVANGSSFGQPYAFEVYNADDVLVDTFFFASVNGGDTFSITNVVLGVIGNTFSIRNIEAGVTIFGSSLTVVDNAAVPLPPAGVFLLIGVAGAAGLRFRKKSASPAST